MRIKGEAMELELESMSIDLTEVTANKGALHDIRIRTKVKIANSTTSDDDVH